MNMKSHKGFIALWTIIALALVAAGVTVKVVHDRQSNVVTAGNPGNIGGTVLFPYQGGTGIGSSVPGDVGSCLKVATSGTGAFTYILGTCGGGSQVSAGTGLSFNKIGSLSFDANMFTGSFSSPIETIRLNWTNGPASRSAAQTISGLWNFSGGATVSAPFEVTGYSSLSNAIFANNGNVGIGVSAPSSILDVKYAGSGVVNPATITIDSVTAGGTGQNALKVVDSTNWAFTGDLGYFKLLNATDTGTALKVESKGSGSALEVAGRASVSGNAIFFSNASVSLNFEVSGYASSSKYLGSAFPTSNCNGQTAIQWATTGLFSCSGSFQTQNSSLTALAALAGNGFVGQTGANTFANRTLTGTTNQINITNGDSTTGNPVWSITTPFIIPGRASVSGNFEVIGTASVSSTFTVNGTSNLLSGASLSGAIKFPSNTIGVTQAANTNSTRIATTAYVDSAVTASNPAVAVNVATTAASDTSGLTYNNGVAGIGATFTGAVNTALTVDGVTFTAIGQRLLVKNDTQSPSGAFNGIYYVTQLQTAILPPILTRALDYDMSSDINNTGAIPVVSGTANANTSWLLTSSVTTVGTDPLTYVQFSYAPSDLARLSANNVFTATGSTTFAGSINISKGLTANSYQSGGLTKCNSSSLFLHWFQGQFSCDPVTISVGVASTYSKAGSLSFETNSFTHSFSAPVSSIRLNWGSNGVASRSAANTWSAQNTFSGGVSVSGRFEVTNLASISHWLNVGGNSILAQSIAQFSSTSNNYVQINLQNLSNGASASSDFVLTSNTGNNLRGFMDIGINSSGYQDATFTIASKGEGYIFNQDRSLSIGTASSSPKAYLKFFVGGPLTANQIMTLQTSGASLSGDFDATGTASSSVAGSFDVTKSITTSKSVTATQFQGTGAASNSFAGSLNLSKSLTATNSITGSTFQGSGAGSSSFAGSLNLTKSFTSSKTATATQFIGSGTASNTFAGSLDLTKSLTSSKTVTATTFQGSGTASSALAGPLFITGNIAGNNTGSLFNIASTSELFSVRENGNVGINNNAPAAKLDVKGTAGNNAIANFASASGTSAVYITKGGNLGIGTTAPGARFHLFTTGAQTGFDLEDNTSGGTPTNVHWRLFVDKVGGGGQNMTFGYYDVSRATVAMGIGNSGRVGINTTSPGFLLTVSSGSANVNVLSLINGSGTCNHNPQAASETVTCSSDIKLKTNIADYTGALAWINSFRVRSYDLKNTGQHEVGTIAQEVQVKHPELVSHVDDTTLGVAQPDPWKLLAALQEEDKKVVALTARLTALETRVAALDGKTPPIGGLLDTAPAAPAHGIFYRVLAWIGSLFK